MKNNKTVAIVPGSFDPITNGHIDIVRRAAELYDTVYLAVMINDQKQYLFSLEERKQIAEAALADMNNVCVISSQCMLWQLAGELCADALVKGYRNDTDYEYEQEMAKFNAEHYPDARTVLLKADEGLCNVSSTEVRARLSKGEDIDALLPNGAAELVKKILEARK